MPILGIEGWMEMTMTNYWWVLIWLILGGTVLEYYPKRQERMGEQTVERWNVLPAVLLVIPYIVWAGWRHDCFGDTALYRKTFLEMSPDLGAIPGILFGGGKDPGFDVFQILMRNLVGEQDALFFLTIGAFQMLVVALLFRRYSVDFRVSLYLFVMSTDYLSWTHNGIRQFLAVTIILAGFRWLLEKRYIPMILLILFASLFHGTALLMLPVIFLVQGRAWNLKTLMMLAATVVAIIFIDRFTPILENLLEDTNYNDIVTGEIWSVDDGTNILRVAVYSVPAVLSLVGLRYVRAAEDPLINVCVNCSIVTMALYGVAAVSSGIYIGRLPVYTSLLSYISLPWLMENMFTESSARLIRGIMYVAYLAFFYYQMAISWGAL